MTAPYVVGEKRLEMKRHRDETIPSSTHHQQNSNGSKSDNTSRQKELRHHAAVLNNIGAYLIEQGEMLNAMRVLQQSVQVLMLTENQGPDDVDNQEDAAAATATTTVGSPTRNDMEESRKWLKRLSSCKKPASSITTAAEASTTTTAKNGSSSSPPQTTRSPNNLSSTQKPSSPTAATAASPKQLLASQPNTDEATASSQRPTTNEALEKQFELNQCIQNGIPGLFGSVSKIRNATVSSSQTTTILAFPDPFHVLLDDDKDRKHHNSASDRQPSKKRAKPSKVHLHQHLINQCPFQHCSKATLFNMGLIHYSWGSNDSAIQFFELSISLGATVPPVDTDLVILACLNNVGQIRLESDMATDAMNHFSDALSRGEQALSKLYDDEFRSRSIVRVTSPPRVGESCCESHASPVGHKKGTLHHDDNSSSSSSDCSIQFSNGRSNCPTNGSLKETTPVHVALARTLMNIGHVNFCHCDFDGSQRTCMDAYRLLHPNIPDLEAAALAYNFGVLHHHRNERIEALKHIDTFLTKAYRILGGQKDKTRCQLQVAAALHRKGTIFFEMGNLNDAIKPLMRTLDIRSQVVGHDHALVAESLFLLAKVLQEKEEYEGAHRALEECLAVRRTIAQGDGCDGSLEAAQTLLEMGRICHARGQVQESLDAYLRVIRCTQRFFGRRHEHVARIHNIVGNLYLEQGKVSEAVIYFLDAMRMHLERGLPIDFSVVQNPLIRVQMSHYPGAASA